MIEKIDDETGEITTQDEVERDIEKTAPFLRTPYNYDMRAAGKRCALVCPEPTLAQQQFKDDCDLNTIVERFGIGNPAPHLDRIPLNEDFLEITDFHTAATRLLEAQEAFEGLPANIRTRFHNNAGEFLDFTSNPENREELDKMGLLKPRPAAQAPIEVKVVGDTPHTPDSGLKEGRCHLDQLHQGENWSRALDGPFLLVKPKYKYMFSRTRRAAHARETRARGCKERHCKQSKKS